MASAYKNIVTVVGSTGDVVAYTCPAATVALVKNINLYNSHTGSVVVYTRVTDSSASADVSFTGPFVLETGDTLIFNCGTASKIQVFANILELS